VDLLVAARPGRGCTVVEVRGDLDMVTSPQLRDNLQGLIDAGDRQVVVDLAGVGFMDSSALGVLTTIFKTLRGLGGRLCLAAVQPVVRSVLRITTVDRAIGVYDSVEAAEADLLSADGITGG
jgi:anti-sigma B factor antagonist